MRNGIRSVEAVDVFREALELSFRELVTTGCTEKGWECPLKDQATSDIRRYFLTLQGCSVHELEFFFPSEAKKLGQPLQNPDISRGRINTSLHFAPVAGIKTDLIAEVSKGQFLLDSEGFCKFVEHDGVMGVVESYHTMAACQFPCTPQMDAPHLPANSLDL